MNKPMIPSDHNDRTKLILFAVSFLVTLWPIVVLLLSGLFISSASYELLIFIVFNLLAGITASVLCWSGRAARKPSLFIIAGVLVILPAMTYASGVSLYQLNLIFGLPAIIVGSLFQFKAQSH